MSEIQVQVAFEKLADDLRYAGVRHLTEDVKYIADMIRADERRRCIEAMCQYCAGKDQNYYLTAVRELPIPPYWIHRYQHNTNHVAPIVPCGAAPIWELPKPHYGIHDIRPHHKKGIDE